MNGTSVFFVGRLGRGLKNEAGHGPRCVGVLCPGFGLRRRGMDLGAAAMTRLPFTTRKPTRQAPFPVPGEKATRPHSDRQEGSHDE